MATLADTFAEIAASNDAHYLSISMNTDQASRDARWMACVQWEGFSRDGAGISQCHGSTPEEALRVTLEEMRIKREPYPVEADPIEMTEAA